MIGKLLSDTMKERKFNQVELADWLNEKLPSPIAYNTVWYWVNDRYNPSLSMLVALLNVYPADDPRGELARKIADAMGLPVLTAGADRCA